MCVNAYKSQGWEFRQKLCPIIFSLFLLFQVAAVGSAWQEVFMCDLPAAVTQTAYQESNTKGTENNLGEHLFLLCQQREIV